VYPLPALDAPRLETVLQQGHANPVEACRFSPDGRYLAARYEDEEIQAIGRPKAWEVDANIRLWEIATGRLRNSLVHPDDMTHWSFRFEGGRVYLVSGCADGVARQWDLETGSPVRSLSGHSGGVSEVAFSPSGDVLYTYASDGTARAWSAGSGEELLAWIPFSRKELLALSPEGFFNSASSLKSRVVFVREFEAYEVERFFEKFYQPDPGPGEQRAVRRAPLQLPGVPGLRGPTSSPPRLPARIKPSLPSTRSPSISRPWLPRPPPTQWPSGSTSTAAAVSIWTTPGPMRKGSWRY